MEEQDPLRLEELLEENLRLTQDNNELLRKIHRSMVWGRVMRVIYWIVIIGIAVGVFYSLQPYLDNVLDTYGVVFEQFEQFNQ